MMSLNAVGAVLEERVSQLQKELDALKAEARAQEASWKTGAERRRVSTCDIFAANRRAVKEADRMVREQQRHRHTA